MYISFLQSTYVLHFQPLFTFQSRVGGTLCAFICVLWYELVILICCQPDIFIRIPFYAHRFTLGHKNVVELTG